MVEFYTPEEIRPLFPQMNPNSIADAVRIGTIVTTVVTIGSDPYNLHEKKYVVASAAAVRDNPGHPSEALLEFALRRDTIADVASLPERIEDYVLRSEPPRACRPTKAWLARRHARAADLIRARENNVSLEVASLTTQEILARLATRHITDPSANTAPLLRPAQALETIGSDSYELLIGAAEKQKILAAQIRHEQQDESADTGYSRRRYLAPTLEVLREESHPETSGQLAIEKARFIRAIYEASRKGRISTNNAAGLLGFDQSIIRLYELHVGRSGIAVEDLLDHIKWSDDKKQPGSIV